MTSLRLRVAPELEFGQRQAAEGVDVESIHVARRRGQLPADGDGTVVGRVDGRDGERPGMSEQQILQCRLVDAALGGRGSQGDARQGLFMAVARELQPDQFSICIGCCEHNRWGSLRAGAGGGEFTHLRERGRVFRLGTVSRAVTHGKSMTT